VASLNVILGDTRRNVSAVVARPLTAFSICPPFATGSAPRMAEKAGSSCRSSSLARLMVLSWAESGRPFLSYCTTTIWEASGKEKRLASTRAARTAGDDGPMAAPITVLEPVVRSGGMNLTAAPAATSQPTTRNGAARRRGML
jgi:hypothetical protein